MSIYTWAVMAALAVPGLESGKLDFRPGVGEGLVPAQFRLESARYSYELEPWTKSARYAVSRLRFPSPIVTPDVANNTVHAEYFAPVGPGPRRPAVVVLHILGADFPLSRYLAIRLADRGVAALFVKLPYYGERRPTEGAGAKRRFLSTEVDRSMTSMRQGVCDVRRALHWLASRPDVDADRLGVVGISLGGIVGSVAAAVDPTATRGVFMLAGGDLSRIMWDMPESRPYREKWIESGRTRADLKALTDPFDPLTHAAGLRGKKILFVAGRVDEVVPPETTVALWNQAGRPPIEWLDCGHYSSVGYLLPLMRRSADFLAQP